MRSTMFIHYLVIVYIQGLFILNLSAVKVHDYTGCQALNNLMQNQNYHADNNCMLSGFEIMPYISMKNIEVDTAEECYKECLAFDGCEFYTFVEPNNPACTMRRKMCYLKPEAKLSENLLTSIRKYDGDSLYLYKSGLKRGCSQKCSDNPELGVGCGMSSPATCAFQKSTYLSDKESRYEPVTPKLHACCNKNKPDHNSLYIQGDALKSQKTLVAYLYGMRSAEECHTRCILHNKCNSWNYVEAPITSYIGGACYLMELNSLNDAEFTKVLTKSSSSKSGVFCDKEGNCQHTPLTYAQSVFLREPIGGTCEYKNLDLVHIWNIIHDPITLAECRTQCKIALPFCAYYVWKWNKCYMAYSNADYKVFTEPGKESIVGYSTCDMSKKAYDCALIDQGYEGVEISTNDYVDSGSVCYSICQGDNRCQAWSYSQKKCHIYSSITKIISKPKYLSASKLCRT